MGCRWWLFYPANAAGKYSVPFCTMSLRIREETLAVVLGQATNTLRAIKRQTILVVSVRMPPWQHCCSQRKWWKLKLLTQPSWSIMIFEADTAIFRFSVWKNGGHGMRARPPGNQDISILGRAVRGRSACGLDIPGTLEMEWEGSIGSPGWNDVSTTYFPRRSQKMIIIIAHFLEFGSIDFKEPKVWEQRGG